MEFRTIKEDGQVQEEIKKSRFICHVKRVYSEEEARDFITTIKKEHYKATHNCSAFIVGERSEIKRTSDDGEPSGTAGVPMLGVLENHNLTNLCVVVTRYFGGIKLGAGGLIRAYAGSVALAVKEIGIIEIKEQAGIAIQMSYAQYQEYGNFLREHHLMELDTNFTDQVDTMIYVDKEAGNFSEQNKEALIKEYGQYLLENEEIQSGYKLIRDAIIFTNIRIIFTDKQGATGRKMSVKSLFLMNIVNVETETAGAGIDDSEITITYLENVFLKAHNEHFSYHKFEFPKKTDILPLYTYLLELAYHNRLKINGLDL